ncbi:uncharacterized protein LOC110456086 [Mizuhopecten yessoensis]|uniref:Uncharacterized protein n=1 Tax=Mizuhopecten yessoensis TaxID=6573 RepID=A0A210QBR1_MIZYE|nr:uncharacterized protein LOC110456086 [Mizuhopecten yessoensis]OWF46167.1 hypothetical protein KP79_PYT14870 [Mizuhopecten yessoensis]
MDEIEKHALELVKTQVSAKLDPFPVLKELLDRQIINGDQYSLFLKDASRGNGDTMLWYELFEHLQKWCSFLTLIDILMKTGQSGLAQILLDSIKRGNDDRGITRVHRIQTDNQKSIRLFFKNLKSQVHDARFGKPREALRMLAKSYHDKLRREVDASRKHYLADKLVAILGVEIDAHAITFDDNLSRHGLFDELKSLVHDSSNTMMTDVSYYGRLANANAIGGRFSEGKYMLMKAQCSASNFTACLEVANMYYIQVYVLLWEFEATHSQKLKQSLIEIATKGMASLQEEDNEIRILWTRMFLLRMIFCLLGIGNRANILPGFSPSQEDVMQALNLLQKLRWEGIWKGIETRREMFFWVAMSRLNALRGDITEAQSNVDRARQLARSGKFKEVTFIDSYSKELERVASNALYEIKSQEEHWHPESTTATRSCSGNEFSSDLNRSLSRGGNRPGGIAGLESYAWRIGLSGNLNVQDFRERSLQFQQISNCPGDLDGLESYTRRIDVSGNLNVQDLEEGSLQFQQISNRPGGLDGLESYTWRIGLSGNLNGHNCEEGRLPFQQTSEDDQFSDLSDDIAMETVGGNDRLNSLLGNQVYYIPNRYYSCELGNAKQQHEVHPDSEISLTDIISPYNSSPGQTTFACSYLRRKEDDDVEHPDVFLFHHASATRNDSDADCRKNELMATNVATTMTNLCDENSLLRSRDLDDDPYSSIDSVQLFGSGIHEPEEPFNSLVLFEDRGEPEGDSVT